MSVVTALCDSSALLLLASGPAKLRTPEATVAMLTELRLPGWSRLPRRAFARTIGLLEIAVAGYVLAVGDVMSAVLLAAAFLTFAVVAARLLVTASTVDCGCFGAASAPVGRAHVVVTIGALAIATTGTITGIGPAGDLFAGDGVLGAAVAVLVVALAGAVYLTITALPALLRARTT